jgi:hypothetical protein
LDTNLALTDVAELNLGFVSSLNFNSRTIDMSNVASKNLWLRIYSLEIKSNEGAGEKGTVLDHNTVVSLGDDVHSSLLEVRKATVGDLDVTVDGDGTRGLIGLVSNKVTADQVDTASGKTYQSCEFLIETVGN